MVLVLIQPYKKMSIRCKIYYLLIWVDTTGLNAALFALDFAMWENFDNLLSIFCLSQVIGEWK
jgi:hypothetical protein